MAMKEQPKTVYRSMQGKEVDMHKLVMQNETTVAIGNVKVNARGDELGPGGKIIRKREDVLRAGENAAPNQLNSRSSTSNVTTDKNIEDMDPEGNE